MKDDKTVNERDRKCFLGDDPSRTAAWNGDHPGAHDRAGARPHKSASARAPPPAARVRSPRGRTRLSPQRGHLLHVPPEVKRPDAKARQQQQRNRPFLARALVVYLPAVPPVPRGAHLATGVFHDTRRRSRLDSPREGYRPAQQAGMLDKALQQTRPRFPRCLPRPCLAAP